MGPADALLRIVTLDADPRFRKVAADRIWNAWWRKKGHSIEEIEAKVRLSLGPETIPTALVACDGDTFLGTSSVIESDMDERPTYTPWVAAVWVEPGHRRKGVGGALVKAAARTAFAAGFDRVYLCARPDKAPFYERLGWRRIEEDVRGLHIFLLKRDA